MSKPPKNIYHYCSIPSFYNIIQSKTLFLSNTNYLNDSLESKWLKQITKKLNKGKGFNFNSISNSIVENLWSRYDNGIYVACFSEHKDLLSQWRGYADNAHGVAIGFKNIFTHERLEENGYNFFLSKIIYNEQEQLKKVKDIQDKFIFDLESIPRHEFSVGYERLKR